MKKSEERKGRGCGCCGGCSGCLLTLALILWAAVFLWHTNKPLPEGLNMTGSTVTVSPSEITVLADITARDEKGRPLVDQAIFDRMVDRIREARQLVLIDSFFFSPITGSDQSSHRKLCSELTAALVSAKTRHPDMPVVVITDPINSIYGGEDPPHLPALQTAGISLVMTDLTRLRDSNALYSAWWRIGPAWLGKPAPGGFLPNPFTPTGPKVGIRSWLSLLNFKANHRKVLLTDDGSGGWSVIVGSLNAHDGSSRHSNLAMEIRSTNLAKQVWTSEAAIIAMSGETPPPAPVFEPRPTDHSSSCSVNLLTEGAIRNAILETLSRTGPGDTVDAGFFYLSHRGVLNALVEAAGRGAEIRLILDPSKDAFGRTKNGIPNRQAASDLMDRGQGRITVRWYDTHGEQFHPKVIAVHRPGESTIIMGSANMTRRNLDNLNLETDVRLQCDPTQPPIIEVRRWFDRLWFNDGLHATIEFEAFEDRSQLRKVLADFQETTGMGTF